MATTAATTYPRVTEAGGFNHARAIFGLVVALVGTAIVVFLYVHGQPHTVEVLKAARDLSPGAILQSDDLVAETEPLSAGLSALVVSATERSAVIGHPLGDGLRRGLPLARAQVLEPSQRIPDGFRVVALPVAPETAAGGQIVPGKHVEILATLDKANPDRARTITVAERVTVYAVRRHAVLHGAFAPTDRTASSRPLSWVSVLADADQARSIAIARATGELEVNLLPATRKDAP